MALGQQRQIYHDCRGGLHPPNNDEAVKNVGADCIRPITTNLIDKKEGFIKTQYLEIIQIYRYQKLPHLLEFTKKKQQ